MFNATKMFNMDLIYIVIVGIGIYVVKAQNTYNAMNLNSFDNRLLALEEANRRLGRLLQENIEENMDLREHIDELERNHNNRLSDIEDAANIVVAFTAFAKSSHTYVDEQIIIFDEVITNIGNHFNPSTSKFTCPKRGLYMFSLALRQPNTVSNPIQCVIALEGVEVGEVLAWSHSEDESSDARYEGDQSSITTAIICDANQNVWVEVDDPNGGVIYGTRDGPFTLFTGVLLNTL